MLYGYLCTMIDPLNATEIAIGGDINFKYCQIKCKYGLLPVNNTCGANFK